MSDYQHIFDFRTHSVFGQAVDYFEGLFATERNKRNIERMSEKTGSGYQQLHHFMSDSPWSATRFIREIGLNTNRLFGDWEKQSLGIDESSNRKSGKHSVGVSRQYNGNLGKVENSQTGVYASLSSGNRVGLVNCRLFLPGEWVSDPDRCRKAGVPREAIVEKSKVELALDMVKECLDSGIRFGWVNADGLYGQSYDFCRELEEMGTNFVVDVHRDQQVYLSDPSPCVPQAGTGRGRKPSRPRTNAVPVEVQQYLKGLRNTAFTEVKIRKGTKGWVTAKVHVARVWVWDGREEKARERTLVIRKPTGKKEQVKYALSSFRHGEKTVQQFAYMQGQRFWIERAFEDAKGEIGMADYQVRKFSAWHHHQAMVMAAMEYINRKKVLYQQTIPLLSVRDVRLQLIAAMIDMGVVLHKEIEQMYHRHKIRWGDIKRYYPENDYF